MIGTNCEGDQFTLRMRDIWVVSYVAVMPSCRHAVMPSRQTPCNPMPATGANIVPWETKGRAKKRDEEEEEEEKEEEEEEKIPQKMHISEQIANIPDASMLIRRCRCVDGSDEGDARAVVSTGRGIGWCAPHLAASPPPETARTAPPGSVLQAAPGSTASLSTTPAPVTMKPPAIPQASFPHPARTSRLSSILLHPNIGHATFLPASFSFAHWATKHGQHILCPHRRSDTAGGAGVGGTTA
jgi:hypothetical protein